MNFRACFVGLACLCIAPLALAQRAFVQPHILERDGVIQGIAWSVSGGQPTVRSETGFENFSGLFSLYGNDDVFRWLAASVNGNPTKATYSIYSLQKGARAWTGVDMLPVEFELPACDADSKEPAGMRAVGRITFKAKEGATIARATDDVKRQKMWLPGNFRIRIGDLPCSRVSKIDAWTVKQKSVQLPDGTSSSAWIPADVGVELPVADSAIFQEVFKSTQAGAPKSLPVQIDYLDGDGNMLMSFSTECFIAACGPADPWMDPADPDSATRVILRSINDSKKSILSIIR